MSAQFPAGATPAEQPPVCPRHPDRISYVRCQRCGRPACPECQRPAAAFLHARGSFLHIAFNMYALFLVGPYLEQALGRWRFVALYLLAAVGGQVGVTLLAGPTPDAGWFTAVVGASGAVFGLFGAVLVVLRRLGRDARQIVVFLVINAVIGFLLPGIAWQAHLGGLVTGLALGAAYAYAPRERRLALGVAATLGAAVLLAVLAVLKYAIAAGASP